MPTRISRATLPFANVTILASPSSFRSVTKPGTTRLWTLPKSRTASQTWSAAASTAISLLMEAISFSRYSLTIGRVTGPTPTRLAVFGPVHSEIGDHRARGLGSVAHRGPDMGSELRLERKRLGELGKEALLGLARRMRAEHSGRVDLRGELLR